MAHAQYGSPITGDYGYEMRKIVAPPPLPPPVFSPVKVNNQRREDRKIARAERNRLKRHKRRSKKG